MSTNTEKKYVELDENGFAPENGWIVVYNYTYETKEFIRQSEEYLQIGVGIPAQSTTITPPEAKEGFTAVFDENAKKWTQVEDHRNEVVYDVTNGSQFNITTLGPVDTAKYTTIAPTSQYDEWDGSKWVVNEYNREKVVSMYNNKLYIADYSIKSKTGTLPDVIEIKNGNLFNYMGVDVSNINYNKFKSVLLRNMSLLIIDGNTFHRINSIEDLNILFKIDKEIL
ncbi:tail fiber assembly protein [Yersinia phage vB_Yru_GN1]|uniref:Tail fiber assembly protein n=1 Tax=Yersinia phage vB_Yru_GN1 TaxID=3074381 RepID=A0AA86IWK5_9CAUD|nr:tail fiber assembly protein [Yersinia phage vB_Yru_GN1]